MAVSPRIGACHGQKKKQQLTKRMDSSMRSATESEKRTSGRSKSRAKAKSKKKHSRRSSRRARKRSTISLGVAEVEDAVPSLSVDSHRPSTSTLAEASTKSSTGRHKHPRAASERTSIAGSMGVAEDQSDIANSEMPRSALTLLSAASELMAALASPEPAVPASHQIPEEDLVSRVPLATLPPPALMPTRPFTQRNEATEGAVAKHESVMKTGMTTGHDSFTPLSGIVPWRKDVQPDLVDVTESGPSMPQWFITALIALIACTIAFALLLSRMFLPDVRSAPCKTHECLEYGRRLASSLNTSVSPCHSFTNFVCDGWRRESVLSVQDDLVWETLDRIGRLVHRIKVPSSGQNDLQRAAAAYKSCYDVAQGKRDELPAVRQALAEAGITWPRRPSKVDALRVALYASVKLGWDVFLRVFPMQVDGRHVVVVSRGGSFVQLNHQFTMQRTLVEKEDFFYALKNSFENGDAGDEATFRELTHIEKIAMGELSQVYNVITAPVDLPPGTFSRWGSQSLSESSWRRVLAELDFNATGDLIFRVLMLKYVKAFIELWHILGDTNLYWLVSWGTVQVAALYANQDLILAFYGETKALALVRQGAFCLSRAYRFSRHALSHEYSDKALNMHTLTAAGQLALRVREAVHQLLSTWIHYDESIAVVTDWRSLDTSFSAFRSQIEVSASHGANHSFAPQSLDLGDSFVANWRKSVLVPDWSEWDEAVVSAIASLEFAALRPGEDFQVMVYSLTFLHFNVDLVPALNYGGLGLGVAQALGMLFIYAYQQNVTRRKHISALLDCVTAGSFLHGRNAMAALAEIITSKALISAYMSGAQQDGDRLIGLESYENRQLLFIAACYMKCEVTPKASMLGLCDSSFQFMSEFAEAFGCSPGTPLNPWRQCRLSSS
ncbi:endothelin-converting enzyme 2-like [Dermacentor albipictus]|uniref:endothelin-converting enzyme 2-like n=1 Tax=Dermacentor albipictus TaxID=60249 RepID=UPI0031FDCAC0